LSRATAGVRDNRTLILNLPGSKKGAEECLNIALPVIKHALALINDKKEEVKYKKRRIIINSKLNVDDFEN